MKLRECFNEVGKLKIDPYRKLSEDEVGYKDYKKIYDIVFDESGFLLDRNSLLEFAIKIQAPYTSDLVGLYHADIHAGSTKGAYPTIYYFR